MMFLTLETAMAGTANVWIYEPVCCCLSHW